MSESYKRPEWLVPVQYNDEAPVPAPAAFCEEDDPPIDYSKGPNRAEVFGEDDDDTPEPEDEGVDS